MLSSSEAVACRARPRTRVRARKLASGGGGASTSAADRRRRDRWLCHCQLRAGELCAVRGKAPFLVCSGAASRRDCLMGFNSAARSSGPVYGAAAAVRGRASSSRRLSRCFPFSYPWGTQLSRGSAELAWWPVTPIAGLGTCCCRVSSSLPVCAVARAGSSWSARSRCACKAQARTNELDAAKRRPMIGSEERGLSWWGCLAGGSDRLLAFPGRG